MTVFDTNAKISFHFFANLDMATGMEPSAIYRSIGAALARRRNELQLTQTELAARVDMSRASVANIERGQQSILVHQLLAFMMQLEISSFKELIPELSGNSEDGFFVLDGTDFNFQAAEFSAKQRDQISEIVALATSTEQTNE